MFFKKEKERITELERELTELKEEVFMSDYFSYCNRCGERNQIPRRDAQSFHFINSWGSVCTGYTSWENHKAHKEEIEKMEKECIGKK